MKRRIFKLLLFLLLGAIINIAVAWGCAGCLDPSREFSNPSSTGYSSRYGPCWRYNEWHQPGGARLIAEEQTGYWNAGAQTPPYVSSESEAFVPDWSVLSSIPAEEPYPNTGRDWIDDVHGWPCYALRSTFGPFHGFVNRIDVADGIPLAGYTRPFIVWWSSHQMGGMHSRSLPEPRSLPLRPLWPGFAINTIFYAAIVWILVAVAEGVCRRQRIKRGLCPACAYPVGASDICTECGKPVKSEEALP